MINKIRIIFRRFYLLRLKKRGLTVGRGFQIEKGCNIDSNFPWLITIGNNVTLSSNVYLVAHDGSTKKLIGYSKVGKIKIEDNVFIGTKSTILPNVKIGENSIVGANSLVTKNIPSNCVAAGNPAQILMSVNEFKEKNNNELKKVKYYKNDFTLRGGITKDKKKKMIKELEDSIGYIV